MVNVYESNQGVNEIDIKAIRYCIASVIVSLTKFTDPDAIKNIFNTVDNKSYP